LKTTKELTLRDLFPLVAKKKQVSPSELPPEMYNLVYFSSPQMEPLDLSSKVAKLTMDHLLLLRKVKSSGISSAIAAEAKDRDNNPQHTFMFTKETAMAYSEYKVIKTNTRGKKQKRILGIDATNIYNMHEKSTTKSKIIGRRSSFEKAGAAGGVAHPFRPISTVVQCEVMQEDPQSFKIVFRDPATNSLKMLQYQTETKMECAEIVAKIEYLRQNQPSQG